MKDDLKGLLKWVILVGICLGIGSCCARNLFASPMNGIEPDIEDSSFIDENSYSGRKAVGMFINTYTGAKVAVCLEDIDNCLIQWIEGNQYMKNVQLSLRMFSIPIFEIVDNQKNPKFYKLLQPSTLLR